MAGRHGQIGIRRCPGHPALSLPPVVQHARPALLDPLQRRVAPRQPFARDDGCERARRDARATRRPSAAAWRARRSPRGTIASPTSDSAVRNSTGSGAFARLERLAQIVERQTAAAAARARRARPRAPPPLLALRRPAPILRARARARRSRSSSGSGDDVGRPAASACRSAAGSSGSSPSAARAITRGRDRRPRRGASRPPRPASARIVAFGSLAERRRAAARSSPGRGRAARAAPRARTVSGRVRSSATVVSRSTRGGAVRAAQEHACDAGGRGADRRIEIARRPAPSSAGSSARGSPIAFERAQRGRPRASACAADPADRDQAARPRARRAPSAARPPSLARRRAVRAEVRR